MVAEVTSAPNHGATCHQRLPSPNSTRRPLHPSESDNSIVVAAQRRLRSRELPSRYSSSTFFSRSNSVSSSSALSSLPQQRCPTPVASRSTSEAAVEGTPNTRSPNSTRRPLHPSESDNSIVVAAQRRLRSRELPSRYSSSTFFSRSNSVSSSSALSSLPQQRCPTPVASRSTSEAAVEGTPNTRSSEMKRAQSVERRRVSSTRPNGSGNISELSTSAAKQLLRRSMSASLQGESFSKAKPVPWPTLRKSTPERRPSSPIPRTPKNDGSNGENGKRIERRQHQDHLASLSKVKSSNWPSLKKASPTREKRPSSSMSRMLREGGHNGEVVKPVSEQRFSCSLSKIRPSPSPQLRKATPERRPSSPLSRTPWKESNSTPDAKTAEPHLLRPGTRSGQVSPSIKTMSQSMDLGSDRKKFMGGFGKVVRDLQKSFSGGIKRVSSGGKSEKAQDVHSFLNDAGGNTNLKSLDCPVSAADFVVFDIDSVCSSFDSGQMDNGGIAQDHGDDWHPSRSFRETTSRLRHQPPPEPGTRLVRSNSVKVKGSPKTQAPKKLLGPNQSPKEAVLSRGLSPLRAGGRPASPSRLSTPVPFDKSGPSRGIVSPSRVRNGMVGVCGNSNISSTPSVLSFSADIRRVGKVGENRICDAHLLRLFYNRVLQWRFMNARAESSLSILKHNVEKKLLNTWKTTLDLHTIVFSKRLELARMRLKLKLTSLLYRQMAYLEEWDTIEEDYSNSMSAAIESLKASTLQLPIVCGAKADIQNLKDAFGSAFDVLQAMASSIYFLLLKVEEVNPLVAKVSSITSSKYALLNECKDIISTLTAMQVKDCSLRTHIIQLKRPPSSLSVCSIDSPSPLSISMY